MAGSKKKYTREFKIEGAKLAKEIGSPEAGRKLGVCSSNIRRWMHEIFPLNRSSSEPSIEELKAKLRKLEKENFQLRKVGEILKKSVGIFSKDEI